MPHDSQPVGGAEARRSPRQRRPIRWIIGGIVTLLALTLGTVGYSMAVSPRPSNAADVVHRYLTHLHNQEFDQACALVFSIGSDGCDWQADWYDRHRELVDDYANWVAKGGELSEENVYVISGGPGAPADLAWVGIRQRQWENLGLTAPERSICTYVVATNPPWIPFTDDWGLGPDAFINKDPAYCG